MPAVKRTDFTTEGAAGWRSLFNFILLAGTAIGVFLMLRGIGQPWIGLGDGDGALFSSVARNYIQFGVSALHGGQLVTFEEISQPFGSYYLHHPPLFPLLVAASFSIFGETETATRLVSVLATLLTAVLLFVIVRRVNGPRSGMLATFFFLTYPSTIVFGRKPGYEALSLFFVVLAVWLFQRYREQPKLLGRHLLFAAIALATATDWPALFLSPALILHTIVYRKNQKLDFGLLTGLVLVPGLVLFAFIWSAYSIDRAAIIDLLHQGMAYMGLVSPDSAIAQHVVEARVTFTTREYIFRLLRNVTLNFGMIPFVLALFGLAALHQAKEFRGIVLVLVVVALGDCLLFWRSLYFHLWWQHLLTAPLAILSAVAVDTLLTSISATFPASRSSKMGTMLLAALALPILVTSVYNAWQLGQEQTRMLPSSHLEPTNFLPLLGEKIRSKTVMGDQILTNLSRQESNPYERILPYYARRVFEPEMTNPQQILSYLGKPESMAGNVYFLLWSDKVPKDDEALPAWLYNHAIPSEISVAGYRFGFFKLDVRSLRAAGTNRGD